MATARLKFLREFVTRPVQVGAVAPSSRRLARRMIEGIDLFNAEAVVELGAGTGSITAVVEQAVGPETDFFAIERSEEFARHLSRRFPELDVICGCAQDTDRYLAERGHEAADVIVSGLPWAGFDRPLQEGLMRAIVKSLRPGGRFCTFAYYGPSYLPKARRFRRMLASRFREVRVTPIVWRNVPPAFAYQCTR
ncbi:MAG: methyltransferase domain-containing protein [Planctomycetes bacterium]|nr:methyltransferase domain-containing protein [Planctomycetota bacterium]